MLFAARWLATLSCAAFLIGGATVPCAALADEAAAPQRSQRSQTLETLLAELRNPGSDSKKLSAFIKANKPDLQPLVQELATSKSIALRGSIIFALMDNADQAAPVLPALIKVIEDPDSRKLRLSAIMLLGKMPQNAVLAIDALLGVAKDSQENRLGRVFALQTLGDMGEAARPAYRSLLDFLSSDAAFADPSDAPTITSCAVTALMKIDPSPQATEALITLLLKKDSPSTQAAMTQVLYEKKPSNVTPKMAQDLFNVLAKTDQPLLRRVVARTLGEVKHPTDAQIAIVVHTLANANDWPERKSMAHALEGMQVLTRRNVIEAFQHVLEIPSDGSGARSDMAQMLAKTGDVAAQTALLNVLRETKDAKSFAGLAGAFSRSAPPKPEILAALVTMLRTNENPSNRGYLQSVLFDVADASALPTIEKAEEEEKNPQIAFQLDNIARKLRLETTGVAEKVKPGETLEALLTEVRASGPTTDTMKLAMKLSGFLKLAKPDLTPLVRELEANKSDMQRSLLLFALSQDYEQAAPALPALIKIAGKDNAPNLRSLALVTLSDMRKSAVSGVQPLLAIVQDADDDPVMRVNAAQALGAMGPDAKPAYSAILALLKSVRNYPDQLNIDVVGWALGTALIHIDATPAGQENLIALLGKDDDEATRAAVAQAFTILGKPLSPLVASALRSAYSRESSARTREAIAHALELAADQPDRKH